MLQLCRPARLSPDKGVFFEGGSIETLVNMLESMHGFTVIPELAIPHLSKDIQKRLRPLKGKRPVREVSLITGPFALKNSITKALQTTLIASLPKEILKVSKKDNILDIN